MSLLNTIRRIKKINIQEPMPEPTFANIYTLDNGIHLEIDGSFKVVEIYYTGVASVFGAEKSPLRFQLNGNKIVITNILGRLINSTNTGTGTLCLYSGYLNIEDCTIITHQNKKFKASIDKNIDESSIDKMKTKLEDDTLIIQHEEQFEKIGSRVISPMQRSVARRTIPSSAVSVDGKIQIPEKLKPTDYSPKYLEKSTMQQPLRSTQKATKTLVKVKAPMIKKEPIKIKTKPTKGGY